MALIPFSSFFSIPFFVYEKKEEKKDRKRTDKENSSPTADLVKIETQKQRTNLVNREISFFSTTKKRDLSQKITKKFRVETKKDRVSFLCRL